ncbi:MAG: DUF4382 domain-containing protein [Dysgonamonadaceae bacterium]|jgi:hypothetical protein|nr:DUF4382 domain-containing protein [Dysgonamonadaceae bacterium]MDD3309367.1 DUF4382 domain-containing protein [Dysgonamonadaceae bacterium]MDD3900372.1 DUF4382 domain-containing protein [Dysgonamonadaceae bacterium]MDD4399010.1 DUF4382 domain-containing protein [Dysgonamonadaceae bacterium]
MKKNLTRLMSMVAIASMIFLGVSCENESSNLKDGKAQIQFKLTDAPSLEYDEVNIDIQGVSVGIGDHFYDGPDSVKLQWIDLEMTDPGLYNLLDFRNGETVMLAGSYIPVGKISQVRLLLGPNSNVVVDGVTYPLTTPSANTSGLKFNLHETLEADMMYSFTIDFDASRSVVKAGNGNNRKFILKPVIRTFADAFGGTIKGVVLPAEANPFVQLIKGTDTLISLPDLNGRFLFPGLAEGNYELTVISADTLGYGDSLITAVPVVKGQITDLDTIKLVK